MHEERGHFLSPATVCPGDKNLASPHCHLGSSDEKSSVVPAKPSLPHEMISGTSRPSRTTTRYMNSRFHKSRGTAGNTLLHLTGEGFGRLTKLSKPSDVVGITPVADLYSSTDLDRSRKSLYALEVFGLSLTPLGPKFGMSKAPIASSETTASGTANTGCIENGRHMLIRLDQGKIDHLSFRQLRQALPSESRTRGRRRGARCGSDICRPKDPLESPR